MAVSYFFPTINVSTARVSYSGRERIRLHLVEKPQTSYKTVVFNFPSGLQWGLPLVQLHSLRSTVLRLLCAPVTSCLVVMVMMMFVMVLLHPQPTVSTSS